MKYLTALFLTAISYYSNGQPFKLSCPLQDAKEIFEKQAISYGKEWKIILSSLTDTTVNAGIDGTVTNVQRDEDGKMLVVFNYHKYYCWYAGLSKVAVSENQKIKKDEILGYVKPGDKVTLRIFDFETPVDPKPLLDCKLTP